MNSFTGIEKTGKRHGASFFIGSMVQRDGARQQVRLWSHQPSEGNNVLKKGHP